jgi:alkanesulfonate monooxygenase SsuD/methylene tetrahydromethanopterin reductase-like flavin-dependent oxidoreductase (luciferase family)
VPQPIRFGCIVLQNRPMQELVARWREVERLGLDSLWVADHLGSGARPDWPWFDGWTCLAAMARETSTIRIGTLVSSITLRPPAVAAKHAVTVDHLSGGRLELGIGAAGAELDHELIGEAVWPPRERAVRFREYVEALDRLLRQAGGYDGRYYRVADVRQEPPPLQRPRPPLTIAAWSPRNIRLAAELGDAWNTMGGRGLDAVQGLREVQRQAERLDQACAEIGRDPATIRRSLLQHEFWIADEPFASEQAFREFVERYRAAGIDEFVFYYPPEEWARKTRVEPGLFARLATDVMPELRGSAASAGPPGSARVSWR